MSETSETNVYEGVVAKAIANGLDKKLPQGNPKLVEGKDCVRWINVAPRTQTIVYLIVTDAGVQLRASNGNSARLSDLRDSVLKQKAITEDIHITPIRLQQSTKSRNFSVKPASLLRKNDQLRIDTTYKCLELVINALQPFI